MAYIRFFDAISNKDVGQVGGKNASLGEMYVNLTKEGIRIPFGFATTSAAYRDFIRENGLEAPIKETIEGIDYKQVDTLKSAAEQVREMILSASFSPEFESRIIEAYARLCKHYGREHIDVAVRSSATAEDLPEASFAGQQETFLNVDSEAALLESVKRCFASLFTDRAVSYRASRGFDHFAVALSVGVQKMVRSDRSASGVMFSIDTDSGSKELVLITSIWGLGENIVGGKVNPDEFIVFKPTLAQGHEAILKRALGTKEKTMVYAASGQGTENIDTSSDKQQRFSISDQEVLTLARYAVAIEAYYTNLAGEYRPMDMEWAKDADDGELYIVQARPETVQSQKLKHGRPHVVEEYLLDTTDKKVLITGRAVGEKIAQGRVKIIKDRSAFHDFKEGEVLVTDNTDPDWEPVMKKASAIVTNSGGRTCHAAIVAREIGVPAIVGSQNATEVLKNALAVTISCAEGEEGYVYEGTLPFHIETTDMSGMPDPKTHLYMNVGNPQKAFHLAHLPSHGVGLARMEFIINNTIKAHPLALFDYYHGKKIENTEVIEALIRGYPDAKEFFVDKLSEGIGMIAAAFYPKPVIVRTSDFKSNEYKNMPGGRAYEPDEENPMIGYRGASRYYSEQYKPAFLWECEALKKVRDDMGLINVRIMIPFTRTPEEGKKVVGIMNEAGLTQGVNGLEIYAMCEIPANVILADEFLKVFDGYSIGSNDLTQLTLGVDRESSYVAHIFDERNEAVKRMLSMAIRACKEAGKYIGICGQAPSDYPEITEFLVREGIDSISLNPDSVIKTWQNVLKLEEKT